MKVITNDERFSDKRYAEWLLLNHEIPAGRWVPASAVGCVAQAMTILCGAGRRFRICAGAVEVSCYYVRDDVIEHAVMLQHATEYESLVDAERSRKRFEQHGFDRWTQQGGVRGLRHWSIPFLEAIPRSEPAG